MTSYLFRAERATKYKIDDQAPQGWQRIRGTKHPRRIVALNICHTIIDNVS